MKVVDWFRAPGRSRAMREIGSLVATAGQERAPSLTSPAPAHSRSTTAQGTGCNTMMHFWPHTPSGSQGSLFGRTAQGGPGERCNDG